MHFKMHMYNDYSYENFSGPPLMGFGHDAK